MAKMRHYYQTMLGDPDTGKRHGRYGHIKFESVSTKKKDAKKSKPKPKKRSSTKSRRKAR